MSDNIFPGDTPLAQVAPSGTGMVDALTIGVGPKHYVTGVRVFNRHATDATKAVVGVALDGGVDANLQHVTGGSVPAGESILLALGVLLPPGAILRVQNSAPNLTFTILGG